MRYHYIPTRIAKIKAWEDAEKLNLFHIAGVIQNVKWYSHAGKLAVYLKTKICLLYDPTIALLGIYPRETKAYVHP